MRDFEYYNPARVVYTRDLAGKLPGLLRGSGAHSVLLAYSGEFARELGILDAVEGACRELGISLVENGEVVPNPKVELVRSLIELAREHDVDFVMAVGGGSSIDTAKAVALGVPYGDDVWDFFEGAAEIDRVLPVGVITTLPASGSETSNAAIISNGDQKVGFEDDRLIPRFAIMNPEYTLDLPAFQTAAGLADIYSHLLERYFSDVEHTDGTDYVIEGAIRALLVNSRRVVADPHDVEARGEVQWLAWFAHNNILDTGREGDWGSHRIEHELSAQYGITHGEGMAVVLVAWTKYAARVKPAKLAQLANRVYGIDYHDWTQEEMALRLSEELERHFRSLGLRTTLPELGIDDARFTQMAENAVHIGGGTVGHYIKLDARAIVEILRIALGEDRGEGAAR